MIKAITFDLDDTLGYLAGGRTRRAVAARLAGGALPAHGRAIHPLELRDLSAEVIAARPTWPMIAPGCARRR